MLGQLLAVGRTSEVFAHGDDGVAKVLLASVPQDWASIEADLTEAARSLGLPAPAVRELTTIDGRPAVIFDRVVGPSMWNQMCADPSCIDSLIADLANVQKSIFTAGVPAFVPGLIERMSAKIANDDALDTAERQEALALAQTLPRGAALLHGDLHPGNILLGADGPVVIDWFDAAVGHPAADVVRTGLLLRADGPTGRRHLPGATHDMLTRMSASYHAEMRDVVAVDSAIYRGWRAVKAVSRLAEKSDAHPVGLHAIWADRPTASRT